MCFPCFGVVCFLIAGPQRWKGCYSICYREGETTLNFYFFYLCCCRFFATRCFASVFSCSCAGPFRIIADLIRYALYNYLAFHLHLLSFFFRRVDETGEINYRCVDHSGRPCQRYDNWDGESSGRWRQQFWVAETAEILLGYNYGQLCSEDV